jgi:hypothetical protein
MEKELIRPNWAHLHQQVLFASDVMDAGGRAIDKKYMDRHPETEMWSTLSFPDELPSPSGKIVGKGPPAIAAREPSWSIPPGEISDKWT